MYCKTGGYNLLKECYCFILSNPKGHICGENFNSIQILSTPTKRKIENDTNVTAMLRHFNDLSAIQPGQHELSGSPAKKRKWGQGGVRSVTSDSSKKSII